MATVEECEQALHGLAAKSADKDPATRQSGFDRSLTCTIRDLNVIFAGQLQDGQLIGVQQTAKPDAQIRLDMTSDDLLRLVDGSLNVASAWAKGRIKVGAGVRDMIKLRSIF
ncbi:MAG: sterol-binding protein [Jatrophihabitans sp.]